MSQVFLVLFISVIIASTAQMFFKKGITGLGDLEFSFSNSFALIPRILQNGWLVAGMVLFGMGFLTYLFVLSKIQLNVAYPIVVSAGIIIISLVGWFFLKETLSPLQILGIVLIILGIFLLAIRA